MPLIYSLKEHRKPLSKGRLICGNSSLAAVISTPWTMTLVITSSHLFSFLSVQLPHHFLIIFCPICIIILLHFQTFCFVYSSLFQYPTSVLYCVAFCFISFQQFYSISYFLLYFLYIYTFYPLALLHAGNSAELSRSKVSHSHWFIPAPFVGVHSNHFQSQRILSGHITPIALPLALEHDLSILYLKLFSSHGFSLKPEDGKGESMFLENIRTYLTNCIVPRTRRQ